MIEILISSILSSSTVGAIVAAIFNRRQSRIQNNAANDAILLKRIEFLDQRITKLEALSCYDLDCKKRV